MTADLTPSMDEQIAAARTDRDALMDLLRVEQPGLAAQLDVAAAERAKPAKWVVERQVFRKGEVVGQPVSSHRWEWVAQLVAHHRERQHAHEAGGHYTVRRADA